MLKLCYNRAVKHFTAERNVLQTSQYFNKQFDVLIFTKASYTLHQIKRFTHAATLQTWPILYTIIGYNCLAMDPNWLKWSRLKSGLLYNITNNTLIAIYLILV